MAGSETPQARRPEAEARPVAAERRARARVFVSGRDLATSPGLVCVRAWARVTVPVPVGGDAAWLCDSETLPCVTYLRVGSAAVAGPGCVSVAARCAFAPVAGGQGRAR